MVSLLDIAPVVETVTIRGQEIDVYGVSAKGLAGLLSKYPELQDLFSEKEVDLDAAKIFELVPQGVADIIAAGVGKPGDPQVRAVAECLTVGEQVDIIAAIVRVTLPGGVESFMGKLESLLPSRARDALGGSTKGQDSK